MFLVSIAGVTALIYAVILRVAVATAGSFGEHAYKAVGLLCVYGILINVGLAVFNLIPAFPLDGFHVFSNLAKGESRQRFLETARYGPFIILALVFLNRTEANPLGRMISPLANFLMETVAGIG